MMQLVKTKIGRLRLLGYLEGCSLIVLLCIAVPMKHLFHSPALAALLGPVHGAIFLVFMLNTMHAAIENNLEFKTTTWKVLVACFIPFGTFYIDHTILKHIKEQ